MANAYFEEMLEKSLGHGSSDDLQRLMKIFDDKYGGFPPIRYNEYSHSPMQFARAIVCHGHWSLSRPSSIDELMQDMYKVNKYIGDRFQQLRVDQIRSDAYSNSTYEDHHTSIDFLRWENNDLRQTNQHLRNKIQERDARLSQAIAEIKNLQSSIQALQAEIVQRRRQSQAQAQAQVHNPRRSPTRSPRNVNRASSSGAPPGASDDDSIADTFSEEDLVTIFGRAASDEVLRKIAQAIGKPYNITEYEVCQLIENQDPVRKLARYAQSRVTKKDLLAIVMSIRGAGMCISACREMMQK